MKRRFRIIVGVLAAIASSSLAAQDMKLPLMPNSVRFLVIGDAGTGDRPQLEVAAQGLAPMLSSGFVPRVGPPCT